MSPIFFSAEGAPPQRNSRSRSAGRPRLTTAHHGHRHQQPHSQRQQPQGQGSGHGQGQHESRHPWDASSPCRSGSGQRTLLTDGPWSAAESDGRPAQQRSQHRRISGAGPDAAETKSPGRRSRGWLERIQDKDQQQQRQDRQTGVRIAGAIQRGQIQPRRGGDAGERRQAPRIKRREPGACYQLQSKTQQGQGDEGPSSGVRPTSAASSAGPGGLRGDQWATAPSKVKARKRPGGRAKTCEALRSARFKGGAEGAGPRRRPGAAPSPRSKSRGPEPRVDGQDTRAGARRTTGVPGA